MATYRIVSESLANVVRHAHATRCTVRLAVEAGGLAVEVLDDGSGIGEDVRAGVGLLSLRERAEELGGHAEVTAGVPRGTRVRALLPLTGQPTAAMTPTGGRPVTASLTAPEGAPS